MMLQKNHIALTRKMPVATGPMQKTAGNRCKAIIPPPVPRGNVNHTPDLQSRMKMPGPRSMKSAGNKFSSIKLYIYSKARID